VDAGKFVTHMGYEVIKAKDNFNYSRSFAFAWSIPYYHLGLRASYPLSDKVTGLVSVTNGWNGAEVNRKKTLGVSVSYAASPSVTFVGNWIGGQEEPDSVNKTFRNVLEGNVTVAATEELTVALDVTYGTEPLGGVINLWKGAAGYVRYQLSTQCAVALRGEWYSDPEGFSTAVSQDLSGITATFEYKPLASLIVRAEFRSDGSTAAVFARDTGATAAKSQNTLLMGAIVVF
jgi:hypothetical protein